jgi:Protein of unknown function (DUF2934)
MTSERLEEWRRQLLRDEDVQDMIRARAYEIFLMRGLQAGSAAQDWFQAENEVLAFLLADPRHSHEIEVGEPGVSVASSSIEGVATTQRDSRATTKKVASQKKATTRTPRKKSAEQKAKRSRKQPKPETDLS